MAWFKPHENTSLKPTRNYVAHQNIGSFPGQPKLGGSDHLMVSAEYLLPQ